MIRSSSYVISIFSFPLIFLSPLTPIPTCSFQIQILSSRLQGGCSSSNPYILSYSCLEGKSVCSLLGASANPHGISVALIGHILISKLIRVATGISLRLAKIEEQHTFEIGSRVRVRFEASGRWADPQQNSGLLPQDNLNLREFRLEASMHHLVPRGT